MHAETDKETECKVLYKDNSEKGMNKENIRKSYIYSTKKKRIETQKRKSIPGETLNERQAGIEK
jgi:hypothetical protein